MQTLNNLFSVLISRSIPFRRWLFISFCLSQLSFFWQIHIHTLKAFLSEKWMRSKYLRRHLVSYFLNEGPAHCFRHWLFGYKQTILQKCTLLKSIIKYISKAINQMRRVRAREKKTVPEFIVYTLWLTESIIYYYASMEWHRPIHKHTVIKLILPPKKTVLIFQSFFFPLEFSLWWLQRNPRRAQTVLHG